MPMKNTLRKYHLKSQVWVTAEMVMLSLCNVEDNTVLFPVGLVLLEAECPQVVPDLLQGSRVTVEGQG